MLETVAMAYLGTMLAVIFAVPLGFLGASNIIPQRGLPLLHPPPVRRLRGLDQLIWALVFVRAMGLGPIAGIMAIAVAETGVLAKLFAEAVENIDRRQVEGITSVGAGFVGRLRFAVLPQVLPVMISQALYSIESNSREATILGLVGAGGIGLRLSERIQINAWDQVAYIIVLILISVAVDRHDVALPAAAADRRGEHLSGHRRSARLLPHRIKGDVDNNRANRSPIKLMAGPSTDREKYDASRRTGDR